MELARTRLVWITHARTCKNKDCCCRIYKTIVSHLRKRCDIEGCVTCPDFRPLLDHYRKCTIKDCYLCRPTRIKGVLKGAQTLVHMKHSC